MWKYVLGFLLLVVVVKTNPVPTWGNSTVYNVKVNLTYPEPLAFWQFDYYYDANLQASRFQHYAPQFDEMCLYLPYGSSYQCDVIFATDGWSYIAFPEVDFCCKCENEFGAVRYDWMQENSTFIGKTIVRGIPCYHWTKQGQYLNHWYQSINTAAPIRFNEMVRGNLKQWDFLLDTYNTAGFDLNLLAPPPNCQQLCPNSVPQCEGYRPPNSQH
jgi:hypothetical protein